MALACVVCAVASYLIGSLNTAVLLSCVLGKDVRSQGSGNAGATNTLRVFGKGAAAIVVAGDALKGVLAVLIARLISNLLSAGDAPIYLAGLCVVLGHNFPVYFGFKGGKGIMTSAAVIFVLDWRIGLAVFAFAIVIMALSRYVSLGSCCAAVAFPIITAVLHPDDVYFICLAILMGTLALVMHRTNILRLIRGTESKLSFKSKK